MLPLAILETDQFQIDRTAGVIDRTGMSSTPPPIPVQIHLPATHHQPSTMKPWLSQKPIRPVWQRALIWLLVGCAVVVILAVIIGLAVSRRGQVQSDTDPMIPKFASSELARETGQHTDPRWVEHTLLSLTKQLGTREAAQAEYDDCISIARRSVLTIENCVFGIVALAVNLKEDQARRYVLGTMADLAQTTDRKAVTYRTAILGAAVIAGASSPPEELFDKFGTLGLRTDFAYKCMADRLSLKGLPSVRNQRVVRMLHSRDIHGSVVLNCICQAILKQAGVSSAGRASTSTTVKLVE